MTVIDINRPKGAHFHELMEALYSNSNNSMHYWSFGRIWHWNDYYDV